MRTSEKIDLQVPILSAEGLSKTFQVRGSGFLEKPKQVHAVSEFSFTLAKGATLGIVGESGCGKSTTARLLMNLIEPDAGVIQLEGKVVGKSRAELNAFRRDVQMVFQDSSASLNPRLTIEQSIMFGPVVHGVEKTVAKEAAHALLAKVGLEPRRFANRYPHEVSGGQRQRINIARALALKPKVVIFDEAVSALDKSIEAQVLNLLMDLKEELKLSYIFISHDLNVVRYISDQVLVMYLGKIIEFGRAADVYECPSHPYTKALLASMPSSDPNFRTLEPPIFGDPPSPIDLPLGCGFGPRCKFQSDVCIAWFPQRTDLTGHHSVACHLSDATSGHPQSGEKVL
ncbi:ABC transporter ATP-binding protein [Falsihalocynthiibacter arcticus]|uniref:Glutathione import ATP-binding protein GsiA n=1 Tax=Falsihalocynthiibacter arcticus TaxID=1579316 RepID=A0A126UZK6_9RHOB|nr:oligopeptide/dipeptide ABC transporter ATP-binding protein [Falsihalocynthiibacter arcticus]AML51066.1 dipeptide/oligopeptide/nickel ABC transporter ATP-binding protein [Falsihalocynthiibacter arcticus]